MFFSLKPSVYKGFGVKIYRYLYVYVGLIKPNTHNVQFSSITKNYVILYY